MARRLASWHCVMSIRPRFHNFTNVNYGKVNGFLKAYCKHGINVPGTTTAPFSCRANAHVSHSHTSLDFSIFETKI